MPPEKNFLMDRLNRAIDTATSAVSGFVDRKKRDVSQSLQDVMKEGLLVHCILRQCTNIESAIDAREGIRASNPSLHDLFHRRQAFKSMLEDDEKIVPTVPSNPPEETDYDRKIEDRKRIKKMLYNLTSDLNWSRGKDGNFRAKNARSTNNPFLIEAVNKRANEITDIIGCFWQQGNDLCISADAADQLYKKIGGAAKPYRNSNPIFKTEGEFHKKGFTVTIELPDGQRRKYKLIHQFMPTNPKTGEKQYYDEKTGFKALAFEAVDNDGQPISDIIKVIFPGMDWRNQDMKNVVWSIITGEMHSQSPLAVDFLEELFEHEEIHLGKRFEVLGNSLGSQAAVYATAILNEKGYDVTTRLIDAFIPGAAERTVSQQLSQFKNRTNNDGENAVYTNPSEESEELNKKISTFNIFPPTMATNIWPWFDAPEVTYPTGKYFQIEIQDSDHLEMFEKSFGINADKEKSDRSFMNRVTSIQEKWELAKMYYNSTHTLINLANLLLQPNAVEIKIGPETKHQGHLVNDVPQTRIRQAQLDIRKAIGFFGGIAENITKGKIRGTIEPDLKFPKRVKKDSGFSGRGAG